MNGWSKLGALACLAMAASMLSAQEASEEESETQLHMHEHLLRLTDIKAAVISGDLGGVREAASWLAEHEAPEDLALAYVPFVLRMQDHARDIVAANDLDAAALGLSTIATDCANCHGASEVNLRFGYDQEPSEWSDMESHMQRHQWAVDRLWEGLIGPSDVSWARGIRMLAEVPLKGTETTWDDDVVPEGDELAREVHTLGRDAVSALTPQARSTVYGNMLGACAECHTDTGGGPGS